MATSPKIDVMATAKVVEAYRHFGYQVLLSNPDCLPTRLAKEERPLQISYAISLTDILAFQWIAASAPWQRALVIGNAFGFSTFVIAALCPDCVVDVIDAEVEGCENGVGSELTRKIADRFFPGVQLTKGFSPQDLPKACRFDQYDFIFIDGMHTNDQLTKDFEGIRMKRSDNSVVYCHDVGMARMTSAWSHIKAHLLDPDDAAFDLHFSNFGCTVVIKGCNELRRFLGQTCLSLQECCFYFGAKHTGLRSAGRMVWRTFRYSTRIGTALSKVLGWTAPAALTPSVRGRESNARS
jgi:predicted O-methyltransferase YrrM